MPEASPLPPSAWTESSSPPSPHLRRYLLATKPDPRPVGANRYPADRSIGRKPPPSGPPLSASCCRAAGNSQGNDLDHVDERVAAALRHQRSDAAVTFTDTARGGGSPPTRGSPPSGLGCTAPRPLALKLTPPELTHHCPSGALVRLRRRVRPDHAQATTRRLRDWSRDRVIADDEWCAQDRFDSTCPIETSPTRRMTGHRGEAVPHRTSREAIRKGPSQDRRAGRRGPGQRSNGPRRRMTSRGPAAGRGPGRAGRGRRRRSARRSAYARCRHQRSGRPRTAPGRPTRRSGPGR